LLGVVVEKIYDEWQTDLQHTLAIIRLCTSVMRRAAFYIGDHPSDRDIFNPLKGSVSEEVSSKNTIAIRESCGEINKDANIIPGAY